MAKGMFNISGNRARAVASLNAKLDASDAPPALQQAIKQLLGLLAQNLADGPVTANIQFDTESEPLWIAVSIKSMEFLQ